MKDIVIDIAKQQLIANEKGKQVFRFSCVTGDGAHPTPKGIFKIIKKHREYRSKKYNAQMNFAMRINWDGVFIHEGYNYMENPDKQSVFATVLSDTTTSAISYGRKYFPDLATKKITIGNINIFGSHGCIRLAHSDAVKLFDWAVEGIKVEVK